MANKNWKGNSRATFATLGASNHVEHDRADKDFYATDSYAIDLLCNEEKFDKVIWENACGAGHLSKRLEDFGYEVISTDLVDRGYGKSGVDFFECDKTLANSIITNPPYAVATEWAKHCLDLLPDGGKLALFLKIQFLESESRRELFKQHPPKTVYVCVKRICCGMNGKFYAQDTKGNILYNKDGTPKMMSSAQCYCWYVWEKGYKGDPIIKWIN